MESTRDYGRVLAPLFTVHKLAGGFQWRLHTLHTLFSSHDKAQYFATAASRLKQFRPPFDCPAKLPSFGPPSQTSSPTPTPPTNPSKTVKKHKQRQGFHTHAGVSVWPQEEEGRGDQCRRGFGAFACGENAPKCDSTAAAAAGSSSWRPAYPLAAHAPGVLASLPWREFACGPVVMSSSLLLLWLS